MSMIFGDSTSVTHKVGGKDWEFWPLSVSGMFQFRKLYGPLASAIAMLTESRERDTASVYREVGEPLRGPDGRPILINGTKAIKDTETIVEAVSPELARIRAEQRQKAITGIADALTDPENLKAFAAIVIDSARLRENLGKDCPPADMLFTQISLDQLPDIIKGLAKANAGVFDPLTKALGPLFARVQGEVEKQLSANHEAPTPNQHGETSPTPSSE